MRICGVDYQGSDLIPVVLESTDGDWDFVASTPTRITLNDLWDTEDVRLFGKAVSAFIRDQHIDSVIVKKRPTGGPFGGGAASFRMGAVLQLATERPVQFLSSKAVDAILKDLDYEIPTSLFKYQERAFEVALAHAVG